MSRLEKRRVAPPVSRAPKRAEAPRAQARGDEVLRAISACSAEQIRVLSVYLDSLAAARSEADEESTAFFMEAISDIFDPPPVGDDIDLTEIIQRAAATPEGRAIIDGFEADDRRFFERYLDLKSKSGLNTYRKIAKAAGISVSTVQAIEDQRIKPQFRTIEKLAKAFNVPVSALLGP